MKRIIVFLILASNLTGVCFAQSSPSGSGTSGHNNANNTQPSSANSAVQNPSSIDPAVGNPASIDPAAGNPANNGNNNDNKHSNGNDDINNAVTNSNEQ